MYIGIRDVCLFQASYETLAQGMDDLELDCVEVAVDRNMRIPAPAGALGRPRLSIADQLAAVEASQAYARQGLRISGLLLANNFNAEDRAAEIKWACQALEVAEVVGADVVRLDAAMTGQQTLALDKRVAIFAEAVEEVLTQASDDSVPLAVENHGFQGNNPEWLAALLDRVGSDRFGLTLDAANFYWAGYPLSRVYELCEQFAPYTRHVHCKNIDYPPEYRQQRRPLGWRYGKYVAPIHRGDIDHAKIVDMLQAAGYRGGPYIEDESLAKFDPDQRPQSLRAQADYLAGLINGVGNGAFGLGRPGT